MRVDTILVSLHTVAWPGEGKRGQLPPSASQKLAKIVIEKCNKNI